MNDLSEKILIVTTREFGSHSRKDNIKRNDSYTHFLQQLHNKLTWLVIFYYFFVLFSFLFVKK
jgi:hypothetical protein